MQKLILCTFCIIHHIEGDGKANNKCHSYIYLVSILPLLSHSIPLSVSSICTHIQKYIHRNSDARVHVLVFVFELVRLHVVLIWTHMAFSIRLRFSDFIFWYKSAIYSQLSIEKRLDLNFSITTLHYYRDINWLLSLHICFFFSLFLVSSLLCSLLFHPFFLHSLDVSFIDVI